MKKDNVGIMNPALVMVQRVQSRQAELAGQDNVQDLPKPAEVNRKVKQDVKQIVKQNDKRKTEGKKYLVKQDASVKGVTMTIRATAGLKEQFDSIRKFYGYSQSDFLAALLVFAREQAIKDGWDNI